MDRRPRLAVGGTPVRLVLSVAALLALVLFAPDFVLHLAAGGDPRRGRAPDRLP